jgi:predicted DNA-binding WGR domain protein
MATPAAINVIANQPVYLVHNNGRKFWEITVRGRFNDIRYGKLRRANEQGVEEMLSEHNTVERALSRAYELIRIKRTRGYSDLPTFTAAQVVQNTTISSSGVFRGTFLDFTVGRSNKFWSI